MWTKESRARYDRSGLRYPSDLTDGEWAILAPLIPPAKRGGQVWDERIGSARVQAKSWRLAFFCTLGLSAGLAAGLVWQSARGTITPWVVQVDRLGQAQAVADYRPTDPQIAWHLARFVEEVRSIPADPVVLRQDWLYAYNYVTDKGVRCSPTLDHPKLEFSGSFRRRTGSAAGSHEGHRRHACG